MAQRYQAPELGPTNAKKGTLPLNESNGTVLVKFYFQGTDVPYGIPKREQRDAFPTSPKGVRQDSGLCVLQRSAVNVQFLRTGLANADGHAWKLVSICQFPKAVTDQRTRERLEAEGKEAVQTVVQLVYQMDPDEAQGRGPIELSRSVRDALAILASRYPWTCRVWFNDGGPITVNLTSPSEEDPEVALVVRDGALTMVPVEVKTI